VGNWGETASDGNINSSDDGNWGGDGSIWGKDCSLFGGGKSEGKFRGATEDDLVESITSSHHQSVSMLVLRSLSERRKKSSCYSTDVKRSLWFAGWGSDS